MPRIPTTGERVRPQPVQGTRVSPASMSQVPEAISQLGKSVSDVGNLFTQKLREAREASEYATAETEWKEGINGFKLSLSQDADYKTYNERFDKHKSELYNQVSSKITEGNARTSFKRFTDKDSVDESFNVSRLANQLEVKTLQGDLERNVEAAVKRGDVDFINRAISSAVGGNVIDAKAGEIARQKAMATIGYNDAWNEAILAPNHEGAVKVIKSKKLGADETSKLILGSKRYFESNEAAEKEQEAEAKESWENNAIEKLKAGKFTEDDIKDAPKGVSREHWWDKLDKRNAAIIKGEDDPMNITDPAVDNSVLQRVYSPNPPTETELRNLAGEGLSIPRVEHWIGVLKKPDAGYKRALDYLKSQIMPSKGLMVGESSAEATAYWKAVIALDEEMKKTEDEGKPLTGNAILKKAIDIAPLYQMTVQEQIDAMKDRLKKDTGRTITRTGTLDGRKVIEYDDGSRDYAD